MDVINRFEDSIQTIWVCYSSLLVFYLLSTFLPKQLSEEETKKLCEDVIKKVGANSIKDMGKVMGELKKTHGDVLDFSKVGSIIKTVLK